MSISPRSGIFHALTAVLLCSGASLKAAPDTLVDSKGLITKGIELHDAGKYKEAIAYYRQVPEGDTNYALALHEQTLSSLADSNYAETRRLAAEGLALPNKPSHREFMLLLGHAADYMGDTLTAFHYYDTLIAINPYDHQPWYEKGAAYFNKEDFPQAISYFRQSLLRNPYHYRSHHNLGVALMRQGRLSEAYIAFCTALLNTSDANLAKSTIARLLDIQQQSDEAAKPYLSRNNALADPAFAEADQIVNAKLALSKDYQYESALSGDGIINTLHVILEKVKMDDADTAFVMQYYMPFYLQMYNDGQFDPLIFQMFSGFNIERIDKLVKKNNRGVAEARDAFNAYADNIIGTQELSYKRRKSLPSRNAYIPSEGIFIVGGLQSRSPTKFNAGKVTVYKNGNLYASGTANAAGEKTGEWHFFYDNGSLRSKEHYENGKMVGEATFYHVNGTLSEVDIYNQKSEIAEKREYTYAGILTSITRQQGTREEITSYHPNGAIEYQAVSHDGVAQDGVLKLYYANGKLRKEITIKNGKRNGLLKEYYDNGQLYESSVVIEDDRDGEYVAYHRNGQLRMKATYRKAKTEGPYEEYDENGKLTERGEFHNGRKTGTTELFTPEGKVYGTITYRKDAPVAYRFTDPSGSVLSAADEKSDLTSVQYYRADGSKSSIVPYKDNLLNGEGLYYYATGGLRKRVHFAADKVEGRSTEYFLNGRPSSEVNFHEDAQLGYYKSWSDVGILRSEGFLDNGNKAGLWKYYEPSGRLSQELFFVKDRLNGPAKSYLANGKLSYIDLYDHDVLVGVVDFDTSGREIARTYFPAGNGEYILHGPNGRPYFTCPLRNGMYNGPVTRYFPDGSISQKGFNKDGQADSTWIAYHPNGTKKYTGVWKRGKRVGVWTDYDDAGLPERMLTYNEQGEQDGPERRWISGLPVASFAYKNGEREGRDTLFGDNNSIGAIFLVHDDIITGYTTVGADGKELPVTQVKAGTAHITTSYPNGQKAVDYTLNGGNYDGPLLRFYSNGQKAQEQYYKSNIAEGAFRRWSPQGQLLYDASFHNDILVGEEKTWNNNGQLISSFMRNDHGDEHGPSLSFDPATGKKVTLQNYYDLHVSMQ